MCSAPGLLETAAARPPSTSLTNNSCLFGDERRVISYGERMTPTPQPPETQPRKSNATVVIIVVIVAALGLCCVVGVLAAIAVPNFMRFNARSKQSEAKSNLRAAYTAEKAYFMDKETYSELPAEVGFSPYSKNRYLYAFGDGDLVAANDSNAKDATGYKADPTIQTDSAMEKGIPAALWSEVGLSGTCPDACSITIIAAGNIDTDPTIDVWSVSTKERTIDGVSVPAGQPHQHVDDTTE